MADYRVIPLQTYPRRAHFQYFSQLAQPYGGLTVAVEITSFLARCQEVGSPFFLSFLYCVSRAANRVPELRQRVRAGEIVEYDHCPTSHTVALEDGTYCYCALEDTGPFPAYLARAQAAQARAKAQPSLEDGGEEDSLPLFFVSCLPWVSYEGLIQPTPVPADTNPRITWGRWRQEGEKIVLPVSLLCNHALVDGVHMAAFYRCLEEELALFPGESLPHTF